MSVFELTVLGARGSIPTGRADRALFGGDSSCYMLRVGEETVFLDAGTGLSWAPADYPRPPAILLSHLHMDHLIGLPMFPLLSRPGTETRLYLPCASDAEGTALLDALWRPPFWPLKLSEYPAPPRISSLPGKMTLGDITVETCPGSHPGESWLIRLSCGGKSIVYATDFEYTEAAGQHLAAFARGADLLMYDGQYTEEELRHRAGYGHSSPGLGLRMLERCGAKALLLIHHDPGHTDEKLLVLEKRLGTPQARYAREGEVIRL